MRENEAVDRMKNEYLRVCLSTKVPWKKQIEKK